MLEADCCYCVIVIVLLLLCCYYIDIVLLLPVLEALFLPSQLIAGKPTCKKKKVNHKGRSGIR